jgi:hypothetical protein
VQDLHYNQRQALPGEAEGRPRTKFLGQVQSRSDLASGLAIWQMSSHQKPTKSVAQTAFEPTPDERCSPIKSLVAPLPYVSCDARTRDIGRSEPTR